MAKETEKPAQEFKPPFAEGPKESKSADIRFAKKGTVPLDDRNKRMWMYSASVVVSLAIVFMIFYLISGGGTDHYAANYFEQRIAAPEHDYVAEPDFHHFGFDDHATGPMYHEEPLVAYHHYEEPVPAPRPVAAPPARPVQPVAPAPAARPTPQPIAPVAAPAPVVARQVVTVNEGQGININRLHRARQDYVQNVIAGNRYVTVLRSIKFGFYNSDDNDEIEKIEEMNRHWNIFRNAVFDTYYENDYVLRANIDYDAFAEDEHLLRLYSDVYFDFFEYLVNEFVMTYEFANHSAIDMHPQIEAELQVLGRPMAKLNLLVELYNILQMQGGTAAVLEAIYMKDRAEERAEREQETGLIILDTSTRVIVHDNLTGEETDYNLIETVDHDILGGFRLSEPPSGFPLGFADDGEYYPEYEEVFDNEGYFTEYVDEGYFEDFDNYAEYDYDEEYAEEFEVFYEDEHLDVPA